MHIVCLTHAIFEGPGLIERWAQVRGHSMETVLLSERGFVHPAEPDFLVVMGGPMNIYQHEEHPYLPEEKRFIRSVIDGDAMVLGVCLGAQLLADVLGGNVYQGEHKEIGWFDTKLTAAGKASAVFGRLPEEFLAFHWHSDTFSIPPEAVLTASSEACVNQAFEYDLGRVVGTQFHLERTSDTLGELITACREDITDGTWIRSGKEMLSNAARFRDAEEQLYVLLDAMSAANAERRRL